MTTNTRGDIVVVTTVPKAQTAPGDYLLAAFGLPKLATVAVVFLTSTAREAPALRIPVPATPGLRVPSGR